MKAGLSQAGAIKICWIDLSKSFFSVMNIKIAGYYIFETLYLKVLIDD